MRLIRAAALIAAALLLASIASAQGLGNAAAREREKRQASPNQPAKVYTDTDLGSSPALPAEIVEDTAADAAGESDGEATAETELTEEEAAAAAAEAEAKAQQDAEEQRAKAEKQRQDKLDRTRKELALRQDFIEKIQLDLNDPSSGYFTSARARKLQSLEEQKAKVAELQAQIAALEAEGRRSR